MKPIPIHTLQQATLLLTQTRLITHTPQTAIATRLGLTTHTNISLWERGKRTPDAAELIQWIHACGYDILLIRRQP